MTKTNLRENICLYIGGTPTREIEEYSSLKVTDSDNNPIKESVDFSEPSFRTNIATESELLLHFHFGIRVAEEGRGREIRFYVVFLCFYVFLCFFVLKWKKRALFIALRERQNRTLESKRLQRFVPDKNRTDRCNGSCAVSCQPLRGSG